MCDRVASFDARDLWSGCGAFGLGAAAQVRVRQGWGLEGLVEAADVGARRDDLVDAVEDVVGQGDVQAGRRARVLTARVPAGPDSGGVGLGQGGRSWGGPMSRINDVGGMQGFPPVEQEADEPAFHADWEAHVFALNRALIGRGVYNLDEFRDAIERMPPQEYLASSYYEKWFRAITTLLAEKGVLTEEEMAGG
jgi:hypothetical protein